METERKTVEIYHKDYRRPVKPIKEKTTGHIEALRKIGAEVRALMDRYPTIINPIGKKNYEYLLQKFEALAKRTGGQIKGTIDYQTFDVEITVICPFFEFYQLDAEWELLKELRERAIYVVFSQAEDNNICMNIWIDYFYNSCSDEQIREVCDSHLQMRESLNNEEYHREYS